MTKRKMPHELEGACREAQEHYLRMVADGQSERFAIMCALQQAPGTRGTDRALMQGRLAGQWMEGMHKPMADRIAREARAAGINISGKFYMGGLADHRAHRDPAAWIDSVADIKKVAAQRDLHVTGIVDYTPPEKAPRESVDIAPDILKENVRKELRRNPGMRKADAVERVKERIVPHWKRKKK
jgi:hypothetical protein